MAILSCRWLKTEDDGVHMNRRMFIASGTLAGSMAVYGRAQGQSAESGRGVRIFVGFERGGGADAVARAIGVELQRRTSRHVVIENRPGTFGTVPGELMKKAAGDGTELALLSSTTLVSMLSGKDFPFDPVKDLAPITKVGNFSIAFAVSPTLGVKATFPGYLNWLKGGDPQRRRIAVSSNTTFVEVLNVLLRQSIGEPLEPVHYRGIVTIASDLQSGRIPACVNTLTSLLPPHRGGRARILMTTGSRRLTAAPDIPTATELGYPKLDMEEWELLCRAPTTSSDARRPVEPEIAYGNR